ncbi:metallophosphoesterase [Parapedobacter indicus]|uniref:Calcineurin-like phosphoesterase n=1 Tax=Parapedobacter indicus TaxID=1477437 RepID=A0A1I3H1W8_9SPHI|nr:metallophosphoesterase [Parapedobacter indicus]PPL02869.1 calcineurin-like phosphoesterase family protein [Parapedobacter indicus]SFI29681.1 Calcineurin-like phosphoesterase [Parapedobacter indicus]
MIYIILNLLLSWYLPQSDNQAITTNGNQQPVLTIGLVADIQYCDCDTHINRYYRKSLTKLQEAVDAFNQKDVDFVINLGDMIDRDYKSFGPVLDKLSGLNMPIYHVLGNHDFAVDSNRLPQIPNTLGMKTRFYSIKKGNYQLIFLDGNDVSTFGHATNTKEHASALEQLAYLKSKNAANAKDWNGGIGEEQFKWLESELATANASDEAVILLCHYPLFPAGAAHNLWNEEQLKKLINQNSSVIAYFNGHQHSGGYEYAEGIHYVNFKGMVEGPENAFSIVNIYQDRIQIIGYGSEESRELPSGIRSSM